MRIPTRYPGVWQCSPAFAASDTCFMGKMLQIVPLELGRDWVSRLETIYDLQLGCMENFTLKPHGSYRRITLNYDFFSCSSVSSFVLVSLEQAASRHLWFFKPYVWWDRMEWWKATRSMVWMSACFLVWNLGQNCLMSLSYSVFVCKWNGTWRHIGELSEMAPQKYFL